MPLATCASGSAWCAWCLRRVCTSIMKSWKWVRSNCEVGLVGRGWKAGWEGEAGWGQGKEGRGLREAGREAGCSYKSV